MREIIVVSPVARGGLLGGEMLVAALPTKPAQIALLKKLLVAWLAFRFFRCNRRQRGDYIF